MDPAVPQHVRDMDYDQLLGIRDSDSIWHVLTRPSGQWCTGFGISILCPVLPMHKAYVSKSK